MCTVKNCSRVVLARGLCAAHYQRHRKTGSVRVSLSIGDRNGKNNPNWKGGRTHDGEGRIYLYRPEHPKANRWGYVYRYRIVMEEKLGRLLRADEIVHHKDENPSNDHPDNLEVTNQSRHIKIHLPEMRKAAAAKRKEANVSVL